MSLTKKEEEICDEFISTARKNGYHDEASKVIGMLCFSTNMKEHYASPFDAMVELTEYIKEGHDSKSAISKAEEMAGIVFDDDEGFTFE